MNHHASALDRPEPLGRWFAGSVGLHGLIAASLVLFGWLESQPRDVFGDTKGGGIGSVAVNTVSSIPLPQRSGPVNPLANQTESRVPEPPPKPKPKPQVKAPEPDAIPLKSRYAERRPSEPASVRNKYREKEIDPPNQLYHPSGEAAVSPMIQMSGGGGVSLGDNSPFGQQFGWYATYLRNRIAQNWRTTDVDPRLHSLPQVIVTFTIQRDGSVPPGSVRVEQRSGNTALDFSAQRAILDAAPFQQLPREFPRNSADVEFTFELRR